MVSLGIRPSFSPAGELFFDETRHAAIFGASGSGKSTLLTRIAIEQVRAGGPAFFLDPHGTFVTSVLEYVPASRLRDVVVFDPIDPEKQIGLNPLKHADEVSADAFIEILANQFGENSFMGRSRMIARNFLYAAVHVLSDPKPFDLWLMFMFEEYARFIFERVPSLTLRQWGVRYFQEMSDRQREEASAAPMNKADALVAMQSLRHIFGQAKGLDFFECMTTGKIVFFNLRKGQIGDEAANLLGSVILRMILTAALQRDPSRKNPHCLVIADEFHNFTKGGNGPDQLLSESRKYGISFILADQTFGQLSEGAVRSIFTNVSALISFCVSYEDAEKMAGELRVPEPSALIEQRAGELHAKIKTPNLVLTNQHAFLPVRFASHDRKKKFPIYLPTKRGYEVSANDCHRHSRANHGARREIVEARINESLEAALAAKGESHEHRSAARSRSRKAA
jgi:hypothetical protein